MASSNPTNTDGLRQRNIPMQTQSSEHARQAVLQLNALEEKAATGNGHQKTYGRTTDGTVFVVPETHDVLSQLLSPSQPKNVSDLFLLTVIFFMASLLWTLPNKTHVPVLGFIFIFWRICYNVGIGWLLQKQSKQQTLTRWARKSKLFGTPSESRNPKIRAFVKSELEKKTMRDYSFDHAPLEYNTWLVFRRIVDLILVCDSTSYVLFAFACGGRPTGESLLTTVLRWTLGLILLWFSLWVKVDAHRVVKDFAWYWGDFFFLVDQDLTFDGAYELAPHPMYSLGYVWLYATSLLMASHKVMFMSIFAHAAQFAFLVLIEAPHIEKTYNAPPPRKHIDEPLQDATTRPRTPRTDTAAAWPKSGFNKPLDTHSTLHLDLYRVTDTSTLLVLVLIFLLTFATPRNSFYQIMFVASAAVCRIWYSIGVGYLLNRQSTKKRWTRHFLKHGESTGEAWRQWKGTYHISMIMCYGTFAAAAWKSYAPPSSWDNSLAILKHTIGLSLVALQIWVAISVYEQLGEFGWFYGDYFFDFSPKLTYGGIYRFLNNPERVLGLAGVWGIALCTDSRAMFAVAGLSQILGMLVLEYVERPHMMKLYGRHLRQDSGLVKSLKRSLPPPLRQWQDNLDHILADALDMIEEFLDTARPQVEAGIVNVVEPTKELLSRYPARMTESHVEPETLGFNPKDYSIEIEIDRPEANMSGADSILRLDYGGPIKVKWTAPLNHSRRDWIGLYSLASRNTSREVTHISSRGRWIATNFDEYDDQTSEKGLIVSDIQSKSSVSQNEEGEVFSGEMIFSGDKLWWEQGVFEFRYHHDGKHNVMAISQPFEVQIPRFNEEDLELVNMNGDLSSNTQNEDMIRRAIEKALLPMVRNCFDQDPDIAPTTATEVFGGLVERDGKYARRVVYAITHMFGIEFAPQVVKADGQVANLAWRILEAQKVLQPYSMSKSRGTSTPSE